MSVFVDQDVPVARTARKAKKKYSTKYNPKYREDFPWAMPSGKGDTFAFCHFCQVDICIRSVGAKGLRDHALTCRHTQKCHAGGPPPSANVVMQEKNVIQTFPQDQQISTSLPQGYQNMCPTSTHLSNGTHISVNGPLSVAGHMSTHNQMSTNQLSASQLSLDSMKIQDQIHPIDQYGFTLQEHDSRYTAVPMAEDITNTIVQVGNVSSTHSIINQSPHSSVNNNLYSVVSEDGTTLQPLYSYPPQLHPNHGIHNRDEQPQLSCEKTQSQIINGDGLNHKTNQNVMDATQGMFQSSQSSYESENSSCQLDKSGGLSVDDLTCNVCGTVFENWMDLKNDLLLHIKHAQEQSKRKSKSKKRGKLSKKQNDPEVEKEMSFPRRKGRPPGIKKKIIEDLQPVMEPTVESHVSSYKMNQPVEEYYVPQGNVEASVVLPSVQQVPNVGIQQNTQVQISGSSRPAKKSNMFACRVCQNLFTSRQLLKDHLKLAHNNGRPFQCDECKKFFTKKSNLEVHKKHKHAGGEDSCKCTCCGKVLSTRTNLRIHLRIHEGKKPFACKVCNKRFNRKANLEMHVVYHTGERRFTCEMCGKSFFAINALKRHRKLHTGERDYACKICGATYVTATDLRRHILKHDDIKPFPCTICEKQFTRSHDLKVHVRYHNKDHQFTCPDCKKKFVESGNYRRHLRRHTGERPYACTHCFQTFTQVHHFKVHVQNQHKDGEECARNRLANTRIPDKPNVIVDSVPPNQNLPTSSNMSVISQVPSHPTHCTIQTPLPHQQMTNVVNPAHSIHGPAHQTPHAGQTSQTQVNTLPGGVIHQYNYVYNSSVVPHYHTIFDV